MFRVHSAKWTSSRNCTISMTCSKLFYYLYDMCVCSAHMKHTRARTCAFGFAEHCLSSLASGQSSSWCVVCGWGWRMTFTDSILLFISFHSLYRDFVIIDNIHGRSIFLSPFIWWVRSHGSDIVHLIGWALSIKHDTGKPVRIPSVLFCSSQPDMYEEATIIRL